MTSRARESRLITAVPLTKPNRKDMPKRWGAVTGCMVSLVLFIEASAYPLNWTYHPRALRTPSFRISFHLTCRVAEVWHAIRLSGLPSIILVYVIFGYYQVACCNFRTAIFRKYITRRQQSVHDGDVSTQEQLKAKKIALESYMRTFACPVWYLLW